MSLLIQFQHQQVQGVDFVPFLLIKLCFIIESNYGALNVAIFVSMLLY